MGLITYENLEDGQKVTANVFNERFAQIVAQINGGLSAVNMEDAGITKAKLAAEVFESLYPVGSQYVNFTDNTNPATLLGFGVWQAIAGRVVVGYDASQTEFNAAEKTGGHKKLQAHSHGAKGGGNFAQYGTNNNQIVFTSGNGGGFQTETAVAGEGDGQNLPPYVVGYVWKRVS